MRFSSATLFAWSMAAGVTATTAFTWGTSSAVRSVVQRTTFVSRTVSHSSGCACPSCLISKHGSSCACPSCLSAAFHPASCSCPSCGGRVGTVLFADATDTAETVASVEEVPPSVEALDGIASEDEAHNAERPARKALAKKTGPRAPRGKPLSEFEVGSTVTGKVRKIADYGAFVDFGGATDGLLHISQLSEGYVASVKDVLAEGQEIQVRIVSIDENKNQVGLSMMSSEQLERAKEAASVRREQRDTSDQKPQGDRPQRQQQPRTGGPPRRDDSPVVQLLGEKGWDSNQFVEGTVASIVEFGAFVRFDVSALNPEVQGEIDGLVHISALNAGRVQSVKSVVKVDDKVQIRLKSISGNKVSLTMISVEDEKTKAEASGGSDRGGGGYSSSGDTGAKDWQESVERIKSTLPAYENRPLVIDLRNGSANGFAESATATLEIPQAAAVAVLEPPNDVASEAVAESE